MARNRHDPAAIMGGLSIKRLASVAALAVLSLSGGCAALAGLDGDYRARGDGGSTSSGGGGASSSSSAASTGGSGGAGGAPETCDDGRRDGDETDVDCGGSRCPTCDADQACEKATDCRSGYCHDQHCDRLVAVAVGVHHSCAVTSAGGVKCWGDDSHDQLAATGIDGSATPLDVTLLGPVETLTAGSTFSCAALTAGGIYCWGDNRYYELGLKSGKQHPTAVKNTSNGKLSPTSAGGSFVCVANASGTGAACWGGDANGQLGDGGTTNSAPPVAVTSVAASAVTDLAAGSAHACAIAGGDTVCWGNDDNHQCGDGSATGLVELAAGVDHTCGRRSDGTVFCWGNDAFDQLGSGATGSSAAPVEVPGISATRLTAGNDHTCGIQEKKVLCWGDNGTAELGVDPQTTSTSATPVEVPGLDDVIGVAAGGKHTCAVTGDGAVFCWGTNNDAELGVVGGSFKFPPVQVLFP